MQEFLSYVDNYIEADRAVGSFLVDRMINNYQTRVGVVFPQTSLFEWCLSFI